MRVSWRWATLAVGALVVTLIPHGADPAWTAFTADSVWNRDISTAAVDPNSSAVLDYLASSNSPGYVKVINTGGGTQGAGIWWAQTSDPVYIVSKRGGGHFSEAIHIPLGATPGSGSDGHMTIIDVDGGYQASLWKAAYDAITDTWKASSLDLYWNSSGGLAKTATGTDCTKRDYPPLGCHGHRGFAPYIFNIRADEAAAGVITHALKLGVHLTGGAACGLFNHYWPAVGDEGGNSACAPEGARIRLTASADCALATGSFGPALCLALKTYGMFVGDKTGGDVHLAVEQTGLDGGASWSGVLSSTSLQAFPLNSDFWEVVTLGG